jgi:TIR domain
MTVRDPGADFGCAYCGPALSRRLTTSTGVLQSGKRNLWRRTCRTQLMAEIFVSWAKSDAGLAQKLSRALRLRGYDLWSWLDILPSDPIDTQAIQSIARASIVIWTRDSIKSPLVLAEVERAHQKGILVPVKTKDLAISDIPAPYSGIFTLDIDEYRRILWWRWRVLPDSAIKKLSESLERLNVFPDWRARFWKLFIRLLPKVPPLLGIVALLMIYIFQGALSDFGRDLWKIIRPHVFGP